jgi:hypothetical protein
MVGMRYEGLVGEEVGCRGLVRRSVLIVCFCADQRGSSIRSSIYSIDSHSRDN